VTNANSTVLLASDADTILDIYHRLTDQPNKPYLSARPLVESPAHGSSISDISHIVVAISSTGGIGIIGKVVIEVIRARRATIEIKVGKAAVKVTGQVPNLENSVNEILAELQDPKSEEERLS